MTAKEEAAEKQRPGKADAAAARKERLAQALRRNLAKRKEREKERNSGGEGTPCGG